MTSSETMRNCPAAAVPNGIMVDGEIWLNSQNTSAPIIYPGIKLTKSHVKTIKKATKMLGKANWTRLGDLLPIYKKGSQGSLIYMRYPEGNAVYSLSVLPRVNAPR